MNPKKKHTQNTKLDPFSHDNNKSKRAYNKKGKLLDAQAHTNQNEQPKRRTKKKLNGNSMGTKKQKVSAKKKKTTEKKIHIWWSSNSYVILWTSRANKLLGWMLCIFHIPYYCSISKNRPLILISRWRSKTRSTFIGRFLHFLLFFIFILNPLKYWVFIGKHLYWKKIVSFYRMHRILQTHCITYRCHLMATSTYSLKILLFFFFFDLRPFFFAAVIFRSAFCVCGYASGHKE